MKNLSILFVFLLFCSCSTEDEDKIITIDEFPEKIDIEGKHIDFDSLPLCPQEIMVIDTFIIKKRMGEICNDDFFYVYNKNSNELLGTFGTEGRGPDEFLYPTTIGQFIKKSNNINLWVHDLHQNRIQLLNINKSVETGAPVIDKSFSEPVEIFHPMFVVVISEGDLVGKSMGPEGRLFHYNKKNDSIKWVEYFPEVNKLPPDHMLINLYLGPVGIKPDYSKIVSALQLFKRIDVFSQETEHLFSIVFDDSPDNPEFFTDPDDEIPNTLMHYYSDMFLSDNYIYVYNHNLSNDSESIVNTPELHIFTWEGKPVVCYRLDRRFISFSVDEDNGYLYALTSPDTEEITSQVFRYDIDEIRNR